MDANGSKPQQERKDVPRTMKEMMETMCCSGEFSRPDMCRRMMRSMASPSDEEAQFAPEGGKTSDQRERSVADETAGGCCGPRSRCAPKRP